MDKEIISATPMIDEFIEVVCKLLIERNAKPKEMKMHPDDFDECRKEASIAQVVATEGSGNKIFGVRIILDNETPRLARK